MKKRFSLTMIIVLIAAVVHAQINTRKDTVIASPVPYSAYGPQFDWKKGFYVEEVKKVVVFFGLQKVVIR